MKLHLATGFTVNLVDGAVCLKVMAANNVKKLVYSSSCTVYGDPSKLPLTEESPTGHCANPYGRTKYIGEMILEVGILSLLLAISSSKTSLEIGNSLIITIIACQQNGSKTCLTKAGGGC